MDNTKILIVDDHQMIIDGYKIIIKDLNNIKLEISDANDCDTAWKLIKNYRFSLVILDISFNQNDKIIQSGETLAERLRIHFPEIKIIIITGIEENLRLQNILKNCKPNAILLKGETRAQDLKLCIQTVLENGSYFSPKIVSLLQKQFLIYNDIDEIDRKILYYLSLGTQTNKLPDYINLSLRTIEVRKRKLKDYFNITTKGNKELLEAAKESGYI